MAGLSLRSGNGNSASLRSTEWRTAPRQMTSQHMLHAIHDIPTGTDLPPGAADYALRGAALLAIILGALWVLFGTIQ
jgi:hypothetical protein